MTDSTLAEHSATDEDTGEDTGKQKLRWAARAVVPLVVVCILGLAGWWGFSGTQHHSYDSQSSTDDVLRLSKGQTYIVSVPGGISVLQQRGITLSSQCELLVGSTLTQISITAYTADSRTVNAVGTFVAPASGSAQLRCTGLSSVWVDDSDNSAFDFSGLCLLIAIFTGALALVIRLQLGWLAYSGSATDQQLSDGTHRAGDQVETGVQVVCRPVTDEEVTGGDGGDISG